MLVGQTQYPAGQSGKEEDTLYHLDFTSKP